ncbi:hypothetical protein [Gulosibacter chungangensis]|uniref:Lipoprotein n=1 Tax=Gulosibacter chungangensis TaxID=979746 RepID=A0A7J5B9A6_9MICO|nr:hypothetical protein [Gulosibacter chungangensis]KAB1642158.1 hypothetical protein F8O05_10050 [Gulosibacter chungangensis]
MKTKQLLALLGIGAVGFGLVGCSSNEEPEAEETTEVVEEEVDEAETTEEEPAESEGTDTGAAPAGDVTAPGTELAFGEGAIVPLEYAGETGLVEITPIEVVPGDPADLDSLDLGAQGEGITPYYITVEVTGVDESSANLTHASVNGDLDALLEGGDDADLISIIGKWEPCESESAPGDFGPGVTFTTCVPGFSTSDTPVAGIQFSPFKGEYNVLDGSPVVWTK